MFPVRHKKSIYGNYYIYNTSAMLEFRCLYCAYAKLHDPFPFDGLLLKCMWILSQHTCVRVCRCVWSDCDIVECGEGTLPFLKFSSIFLWWYGEWRGTSSPFSCVV